MKSLIKGFPVDEVTSYSESPQEQFIQGSNLSMSAPT